MIPLVPAVVLVPLIASAITLLVGHRPRMGRQQVAGPLLMRRIDVGVQETDRHCLDPCRLQHPCQTQQRVFVQRQQHRTVRRQPLRNLQPQVALHQLSADCSAQPGCGADRVSGARPSAMETPSTSNAIALTAVVEQSMPIT